MGPPRASVQGSPRGEAPRIYESRRSGRTFPLPGRALHHVASIRDSSSQCGTGTRVAAHRGRTGAGRERKHRRDGPRQQRRLPAGRDGHRHEHGDGDDPIRGHQRERRLSRSAASAGALQGVRGASGVQDVRAAGHHPVRRPDGVDQRRAQCRERLRDDHRIERVADRAAGQDRSGANDRRAGGPQSPAHLAQSLQLRVPPGERHGLREQRVRRTAHQRERLADAHQLPARRQHEYREGPGRSPHAANLRDAGAGSKSDHQRVRAGVRPDDRHGLQRDYTVRHERPSRLDELPVPAQSDVRPAVLPLADSTQA